MYLVGYMPAQDRVYVADKDMNLYPFALSLSFIQYQSAALHGELDVADEILPSIPVKMRNKLARFLDAHGTCESSISPLIDRQTYRTNSCALAHMTMYCQCPPFSRPVSYGLRVCLKDLKEQALQLTTDPDHKFDLAIGLNDVESALSIARSTPAPENEAKWKIVGDRALAAWRFDLAKECFENAGDVSSLFLFHLAAGDRPALQELAKTAGKRFFVCIPKSTG